MQDFHLEGPKRLCASMHITSAEPNSLSAGVQGPLKGPGSSTVVLMLSRAIWALFLSILIFKNGIKNSWFNFRGRLLRPPPPWIHHCCVHRSLYYSDHIDCFLMSGVRMLHFWKQKRLLKISFKSNNIR